MLHAMRHRRFKLVTWLVVWAAVLQPALAAASYRHALQCAAHGGLDTPAPTHASAANAMSRGHAHVASVDRHAGEDGAVDSAAQECECQACLALSSPDLVHSRGASLHDAVLVLPVAPAWKPGVLPTRGYPCGLGSRGPPRRA